jgi:hypothetical protein
MAKNSLESSLNAWRKLDESSKQKLRGYKYFIQAIENSIPLPYGGSIIDTGFDLSRGVWWVKCMNDCRIIEEIKELVNDPNTPLHLYAGPTYLDFCFRNAYNPDDQYGQIAQVVLYKAIQYWAGKSAPKKGKYSARKGYQTKERLEDLISACFVNEIKSGYLRTYNPFLSPVKYLRRIISLWLTMLLKKEYPKTKKQQDEELFGNDYSSLPTDIDMLDPETLVGDYPDIDYGQFVQLRQALIDVITHARNTLSVDTNPKHILMVPILNKLLETVNNMTMLGELHMKLRDIAIGGKMKDILEVLVKTTEWDESEKAILDNLYSFLLYLFKQGQ